MSVPEQFGAANGRLSFGDWKLENLTRSPVVGDLNVVQQELVRYEANEKLTEMLPQDFDENGEAD